MLTVQFWVFASIGLFAGVLSGLFGIGGGIVIVPALVYVAGFDQHLATGTSLAVLLPPVGVAAALEYYRQGHVNLAAALVIAATLLLGGWLGAMFAGRVAEPYLRLAFGVFVLGLGASVIIAALRELSLV